MNGSIHKLLLYYRPHNIGLRLRHKSLFLTYVLAPLCAISNFNYEQVNPRNFPAAMLLHGKLSFRKPVLRSPSSGFFVHRAFPIDARSYSVHLGRVITSPRCTVGRVNPSSSAFYQSKGRVDGSLDEPMSEHSMGTCTWHSLTYRMRSTMGSCFVRHVGASCNSLQKRHAEYQLGCLLPCLCMPSRKQRVIHCFDEDAPGSLSIGVSAQLRVDVAADRCWFKSSVMRFT